MIKQRSNDRGKFLKKTQEVLYAKEFKRANQVYDQFSQQKNRSMLASVFLLRIGSEAKIRFFKYNNNRLGICLICLDIFQRFSRNL